MALLPDCTSRSLVCSEDLNGSQPTDWRPVSAVPELASAIDIPASPEGDAALIAAVRTALADLWAVIAAALTRKMKPPPEVPLAPEPATPVPEAAPPAPEPIPPVPEAAPSAPEPLQPVVAVVQPPAAPRWRRAAAAVLCGTLLAWALLRKPPAPASGPAPEAEPAASCPKPPAPCPGPEAWSQDALDDREIDAIELVRGWPAKESGRTVGQTLDRLMARSGRTSPWNAERLSEDSFKVDFTVYEFEAGLSGKSVAGRNAASRALLR
ncbi:MAG: hypothetical protein HY926_08175 [Elusimicrobia bacterium]|nr:hypothetical protein [Elusimicrobiota bacterium]